MTIEDKFMPIANAVREFMKMESAGGILLLAAAIIAMLVANSPLAGLYSGRSALVLVVLRIKQ